jgi:tRNA pseudouridine32 synthase/23S rRNA pseudouridine746 synthase
VRCFVDIWTTTKGIDAVIAKDPALFPLMSICSIHGKPARSRYRVVERFYCELEDRALLLL